MASLPAEVQPLELQQIHAEDRTFAISLPWWPSGQLTASIEKVGILSPLFIQERLGRGKRIVRGFRRYQTARRLGLQMVPCLISHEERNELELFCEALLENLATRPLHLLEKAAALLKLCTYFQIKEGDLIEQFLPLLGIKGDRFHLQQHLSLARLPERLQRAVADSLEPEVALGLPKWTEEEQGFFLELMRKYQLGRNKQKELFWRLEELREKARSEAPSANGPQYASLAGIWEASGSAAIDGEERIPPPERFQVILEKLRRLRFPHLAQHQKRYEQLKATLRIPPEIHFQAPAFFEGDRITVSFSFRRAEELRALAEKLAELAKRKELDEIVKLL